MKLLLFIFLFISSVFGKVEALNNKNNSDIYDNSSEYKQIVNKPLKETHTKILTDLAIEEKKIHDCILKNNSWKEKCLNENYQNFLNKYSKEEVLEYFKKNVLEKVEMIEKINK